jgi:uncharacterized protein YjiS (DUF1127 family)
MNHEVWQQIANFGFAAIVAFYALTVIARKLDELRQSIEDLRRSTNDAIHDIALELRQIKH